MKNIKYYLIIPLVLILGSCKDFLEITPRDVTVDETAFKSLEDLEMGAKGVYAAISGANLISMSSRMGDNLQLGGENRGQGRQTHDYAFTSSTSEAAGIWSNLYIVVARLNRVLASIDRLNREGTITESESNYLKGEMLAIRAMEHFDLWRVYSEKYNPSALAVPWIGLEDMDGNGRLDGLDPDIKPSRQTTAFLFEKIDADLALAKTLLKESTDTSVYRINEKGVIALQARVALYTERYADAITYATEALNGVGDVNNTTYPLIWTDQSEAGVIFALRRVAGDGAVGAVFTDISNEDRFFQPAEGYIDLFDQVNDIRYVTNIGTGDNGVIVGKYPGIAENPGLNNIKILRASEMTLILAEAYAMQDDLINGTASLNSLRSNRITGYTDETFADVEELMEAIEVERRKELGYEGHRWFDLKRWGEDLVRDSRDCTSGAIPCSVAATDYRWRFPIPQAEIFANDNMVQNPNYTSSEED